MNERLSTHIKQSYRRNSGASHSRTDVREDLCAAARRYAQSIATDDSMFVRAFLTALNNGAQLRHPSSNKWIDNVAQEEVLSPAALVCDPVYVTNARRLYASPRTVTIPYSEDLHPTFGSCVAIEHGGYRYTGVLVARNVVVTAAHAANVDAEMRVLVGSDTAEPGQKVRVRGVRTHPEFDTGTHANDIAVLILDDDIAQVRPADIADPSQIDSATTVRVVGFGHDDALASVRPGVKRAVDVPVASAQYADARDHRGFRCDPDAELVIGLPALDRDRCAVDGGAPCYVRAGNGWRLAGIVSRPVPGYHNRGGDGVVAVRLDNLLSWIRSMDGGKW